MNKRAIIVHGWDGYPEEGWFPWLKEKLEEKEFLVTVPALPDASLPRIEKWVPALAEAVGTADKETYFIGHSMGCQTIARYLEGLPTSSTVGGAVFVAGFFKCLSLEEDEEDPDVQETERLWLGAPLDLKKVAEHLPKSVAIFSDNDPYVPLVNQEEFKELLHSEIIVEHNKGHFSGSTGTTELPSALESVIRIAT